MQKIGVVVDNLDPDYTGRVKVRILGVHTQQVDNKYIISDDDLPWFINGNMNNGNFSIPKLGELVAINTDDNYTGFYYGNIYSNKELIDYFKSNTDDYQNASVVLYDNCLGSDLDDNNNPTNYRDGEFIKMYYVDSKGFCIEYKTQHGESKIILDPENNVTISSGENKISIDLSSNKIEIKADSEISLDANKIKLGKDAIDGIIKSQAFMNIFNTHTHQCPLFGPSTPPTIGLDKSVLSDKVKM